VLALTGDDEANLAVTMATALLRPDLRVVARTGSRAVAERMQAFGDPDVINPFDRFGDHLRILLRSPAAYQLMVWLTSPVGTELPPAREPLPRGRWVVYGRGSFGTEVARDLLAEGIDVTVVGPGDVDAFDPDAVLGAGLEDASGLVAATASDTTNLSLVKYAASLSSELFLVARQNGSANSPLYRALGVDLVLVPADVLLHEVLARLVNPLLLPFLRQVPHQGEAWSARLVTRLTEGCGPTLGHVWRVSLTAEEAPGPWRWLEAGEVTLADLLRRPEERDRSVAAVVLMLKRGDETSLAPAGDVVLRPGDELLVIGLQSAQRAVDQTLHDEATAEYVVTGRPVATGWLWRRLAGRD
jgi:Trk K+ transport system NAD-binding subunit